MVSKKENFIDELQIKIGNQFYRENENHLNTGHDLVEFFLERHQKSNWKFLNFLPFYFETKQEVEAIFKHELDGEFDLNELSKSDKASLDKHFDAKYSLNLVLKRPQLLHQFIFIFPLITVLGCLLISTYLITVKDYSGWIYLSALSALLISLALILFTQKMRTKFHPKTILEYCKFFYVIHHQNIKKEFKRNQLETFILNELTSSYGSSITLNDSIE